jgi:type III secretion protein R
VSDSVANAGMVALVAIVPLVVLMLTSFVKVSVVLSLLRNAIGATDAPSGLVVMGVSLILTFFLMAPVAVEMVTAAATPGAPAPTTPPAPTNAPAPSPNAPAPRATTPSTTAPTTTAPTTTAPTTIAPSTTAQSTTAQSTTARSTPTAATPVDVLATLRTIVPADRRDDLDALGRALVPLKAFLGKHATERDKATFVDIGRALGQARTTDELAVLAPAFVTTELREAFAIAVLIFVPFLVIDLLVGLGLAALGLQSTSPQTVALPLKLLLFVAVDGWRLLVDSLLRGYA